MRVLVAGGCFKADNCKLSRSEPAYADGFIAPNGTFYRVGSYGHYHAAVEHGMCEIDQLEAEGWVHFSLAYRDNPIVNKSVRLTQGQRDTLFDMLMAIEGVLDNLDGIVSEWIPVHNAVLKAHIERE